MTQLDDPGAWLCHYTRAATAFTHILPTGLLQMNPYSRMRDPFENRRPRFRSAAGSGADDNKVWKRLSAIQDEVGRSRDEWRLLSLSEGAPRDDDDSIVQAFRCPWSRARMWEQYADDHAGACLVFDRPALVEALHHNLGAKGTYRDGSVEYTPAGFAASQAGTIRLDQFHEASLADDVALHVEHNYRDFFFLKTQDWASEYEYRFVFRADDLVQALSDFLPSEHLVSYGGALRYVVVGEKFPDWQIPGAREVAKHAGVELRRMAWEDGQPYPEEVAEARG